MCVIVDANFAEQLCREETPADVQPLAKVIDSGKLKVVCGGKLTDELIRNAKVSYWLNTLAGRGCATFMPNRQVKDEQVKLKATGKIRSNDAHVLALARVSGARLLVTRDKKLQADFGDRELIRSPRGRSISTPVAIPICSVQRHVEQTSDVAETGAGYLLATVVEGTEEGA